MSRFRCNKTGSDFTTADERTAVRIEAMGRKNLLDVLAGLEPLGPDDELPNVDDTLLPAEPIRFDLDELVEEITTENVHEEANFGVPVGKERL